MNNEIHSIFSDMNKITNTIGYMPDGANCPKCDGLRTDTPEREVYAARRASYKLVTPLCKCVDKDHQKWAGLVSWANLPHERVPDDHRTFATWAGTDNADALAASKLFATGDGPHILTLFGPPDGGKSHLLEAIGRFNLAAGRSVRYSFASAFLDDLRMASVDDGTTAGALMETYAITKVILLDDIAVENANSFAVERLTSLVDHRYRDGLRLAVATNLGPEKLGEKLGERIASRLFDEGTGAVNIVMMKSTGHRKASP